MSKKKVTAPEEENNKPQDDLASIHELGLDLGLGEDDLIEETTEETLTIIIEDDEELQEDEEFLLGIKKKKKKEYSEEDEDAEDFDSYFFEAE